MDDGKGAVVLLGQMQTNCRERIIAFPDRIVRVCVCVSVCNGICVAVIDCFGVVRAGMGIVWIALGFEHYLGALICSMSC